MESEILVEKIYGMYDDLGVFQLLHATTDDGKLHLVTNVYRNVVQAHPYGRLSVYGPAPFSNQTDFYYVLIICLGDRSVLFFIISTEEQDEQ